MGTKTNPDPATVKALSVRRRLLAWSRTHGRSFEWRNWTDVYSLVVTEILLRQTRADTVAAFVPGFLRRYPTPDRLAGAGPDLERALVPLGFGRQRSSQLRALASALKTHPPGVTAEDLRTLPGVGPYSAGIIAATLGAGEPAVDTNVSRVICRVFGVKPSHSEPRKSRNVWEIARQLTKDAKRPANVTWAILDLAAGTCINTNPHCSICPLRTLCDFRLRSNRGEPPG